MQLQNLLNQYVLTHPYPRSEAELNAALKPAHLSLKDITDPWGRSLYAVFHTRTIFTDAVRTETHASPGVTPANRTTVTPVTAISDIITLRSNGPDGKQGTPDDFTLDTLNHLRSQQSAKDRAETQLQHQVVNTGDTGSISGIITDPTGAVIPNALVSATRDSDSSDYTANADSAGFFQIAGLPPGRYGVRITAPRVYGVCRDRHLGCGE